MKSVAGSLKLELAQFREIEGFEQFGDSLDKSTLDLLKKGKCLTQLLKQFKYAPLSLDNEIISIFAGVNGYLDNIVLSHIYSFESLMHRILNTSIFCASFKESMSSQVFKEEFNLLIKMALISNVKKNLF